MSNIDNLRKKVDKVQNRLDWLKDNISILPEPEKKTKVDEFKTMAEYTKLEIQAEILRLSMRRTAENKRQKAEAEVLLNTVNEIINLQSSILTWNINWTSEAESSSWDKWKAKDNGDKPSFWDTWRWNTLKRSGIIGGIGAGIARLGSKLTWSNDEETDEEDDTDEESTEEKKSWGTKKKKKKKKTEEGWSRRKKWLLWAWWIAWSVFWWTAIYKNRPAIKARFNEKLWIGLTMEQSIISATSEVRSWLIDESPFHYNFEDGIQYDGQRKAIKSYWWETQIDPVWMKLVWLDNVVFKDYKELIHAANITNCLKSNFHHCCASSTPFDRTTWWGWDLQITLADGSQPEVLSASDTNAWARTWWVGWTVVWWLLWAYCGNVPWAIWWAVVWWVWWAVAWNALDNNSSMGHTVSTIASWNNFEKFRTYLNQQTSADGKSLWLHGKEVIHTESPLQDLWQAITDEIVWTYSDNGDSINRNIDIWRKESEPSKFEIKSYNETAPLVIEWLTLTSDGKIDYSKIKSIKIGKYREYDRWEWLELDFPHTKDWIKEAIKVANLTNKIRNNFYDKWWEQHPFWVRMYGYHRHLQIDDRWYRWRDVVYRGTLSWRFPILRQDLNKQIDKTDQAKLRKQAYDNKDQEWYGSKYIRYLHQMREQNWTLSYWRHEND